MDNKEAGIIVDDILIGVCAHSKSDQIQALAVSLSVLLDGQAMMLKAIDSQKETIRILMAMIDQIGKNT